MRPEILFDIAAPLTSLPKIGVQFERVLSDLITHKTSPATITDLLYHLPVNFIDRSHRPQISQLEERSRVSLKVVIGKHTPPKKSSRMPYRVEVFDDSGAMTLVFFHMKGDYLRRVMPENSTRFISGIVEFYRDKPQMTHPEYIFTQKEYDDMPLIEPVYRLRAGVSLKRLGKIMRQALQKIPNLAEWDSDSQEKHGFPKWADALRQAHHPQKREDLDALSKARQRLAYDELLANQLALALIRNWMRSLPSRHFSPSVDLRKRVLATLDFELTQDQKNALGDIDRDMSKSQAMLRLLQGDVGSGKTIIGFLAMLNAVEAGAQSVLMAPTEILSQQHYKTLHPLCQKLNLNIALLTSQMKGAKRDAILKDIANGQSQIIIGTHSLFQDELRFQDLGFITIDEQHRFGVEQRLRLAGKANSKAVDILVMSATPIPRSLTLTNFGDMDVSYIKQKPRSRPAITTRAIARQRLDDVIGALIPALKRGERAFWVCPLIEKDQMVFDDEGDSQKIITVKERVRYLSQKLDSEIGCVHGKMASEERAEILENFRKGQIQLLVATSVIEVGIDIPQATIMIIEHAERFGLAQLHQLRGRVGRGKSDSSCLLLYSPPLNPIAKQRLDALRLSNDGFYIAEEDLRLRGHGELLGTKQSGETLFQLADLRYHDNLLKRAHAKARQIIRDNPKLEGKQGEALRLLLYLFRLNEAIDYPRSG